MFEFLKSDKRKLEELKEKWLSLYKLEKYTEAEPFIVQSLELCEKALGKDHIEFAEILTYLASTYENQNKYSEAENSYLRSIAICEKALGKDNHKVKEYLENLASFSYRKKNTNFKATKNNSILALTRLNLGFKKLTELSDSIDELTNLTELFLYGGYPKKYYESNRNRLIKLPESIGKLINLTELDLSYNELTSLPESIGNLINLTKLQISGNQLTTLPESIGNLRNLIRLDLDNNQLTELPESIGNLINLGALNLNNNQLTELPESIGNLIDLGLLCLESNHLRELPESIGKLTELSHFDLRDNPIKYPLPTKLRHIEKVINDTNEYYRQSDLCSQEYERLKTYDDDCIYVSAGD